MGSIIIKRTFSQLDSGSNTDPETGSSVGSSKKEDQRHKKKRKFLENVQIANELIRTKYIRSKVLSFNTVSQMWEKKRVIMITNEYYCSFIILIKVCGRSTPISGRYRHVGEILMMAQGGLAKIQMKIIADDEV